MDKRGLERRILGLIISVAIIAIIVVFIFGKSDILSEDKNINERDDVSENFNVEEDNTGLNDITQGPIKSKDVGIVRGSGGGGGSSSGGAGDFGEAAGSDFSENFNVQEDNTGNTRVEREVGNFVLGDESEIVLHIDSDENVIGIREADDSVDDWEIVGYDLSEEYEIFEFKKNTNEWIIADSNKEISVDLIYTVIGNVNNINGKYFISSNDGIILEGEIEGDLAGIQLSPDSKEIDWIVIIIGILLILIVLIFFILFNRRKKK